MKKFRYEKGENFDMKITWDDIKNILDEKFSDIKQEGLREIQINSGELHRELGSYPGSDHRMPMVCKVMRDYMRRNDVIIQQPPKGNGASLTILYYL